MRRILFKAFHPTEDGNTLIYVNGKNVKGYWVYGDCHQEGKYIYEPDGSVRYQVIPETMCEFSGLTTPKGVDIFENDMCKWIDDDGDACFFGVEVKDGCFMMREGEYYSPLYECINHPELEVISNAFEFRKVVQSE